MKKIEAIIRPNRLPAVTLALHRMQSLAGVTITDARGFGCRRSAKSDPRIVQDLIDYRPFTRIEIVCPDDLASGVMLEIEQAASSGQPGDGKIFVSEIAQAVRIANGERGEQVVTRPAQQAPEDL